MIVVNNGDFRSVVHSEIERLGNEADLNHIDVSDVTNMWGLFNGSDFNGDISNWDVSNVENMGYMFSKSKFNQDISNWDVSNVENMYSMFSNTPFNQDIRSWNINLKNIKEEPDGFENSGNKFIESLFKAYKNNNKNDIDNLSRKIYINHIRKRLKI